jgi:hypothetical protein
MAEWEYREHPASASLETSNFFESPSSQGREEWQGCNLRQNSPFHSATFIKDINH